MLLALLLTVGYRTENETNFGEIFRRFNQNELTARLGHNLFLHAGFSPGNQAERSGEVGFKALGLVNGMFVATTSLLVVCCIHIKCLPYIVPL